MERWLIADLDGRVVAGEELSGISRIVASLDTKRVRLKVDDWVVVACRSAKYWCIVKGRDDVELSFRAAALADRVDKNGLDDIDVTRPAILKRLEALETAEPPEIVFGGSKPVRYVSPAIVAACTAVTTKSIAVLAPCGCDLADVFVLTPLPVFTCYVIAPMGIVPRHHAYDRATAAVLSVHTLLHDDNDDLDERRIATTGGSFIRIRPRRSSSTTSASSS